MDADFWKAGDYIEIRVNSIGGFDNNVTEGLYWGDVGLHFH